MSFLKPAKPARAALAGFAILLALYVTYAVIRLAFAANSAIDLGNTLQQVNGIDTSKPVFAKIDTSISRAIEDLSTIKSATNDPLLAPITLVPWIGRDFAAVKTLSIPALDLASSLRPCALELAGLEVKNPGKSIRDEIAPVTLIISKHFAGVVKTLHQADVSISKIDSAELHFGLAQKMSYIQASLATGFVHLKAVQPYLAILSTVLNTDSPTNWFIATQNLAEARGTGGILGSYAVINADHGFIKLLDTGSDLDLVGRGKVNPKALPQNLQELWNADPTDWRDLNTSIHVPYFAKQIVENFHGKNKVGGVIFLGQGIVSTLVGALGSVTYQGDTLNASNTTSFLTQRIYSRHPLVNSKMSWLKGFMKVVFTELSNGKINLASFFSALQENLSNDRLMAWSSEAKIESQFVAKGVSGTVDSRFGSRVYFSFNNAGGNKLDAYLVSSAKYELGKCDDFTDGGYFGRQAFIRINVASHAPKTGLPWYVNPPVFTPAGQEYVMGANRTLVSVYGPVGASIRRATLDGNEIGNSEGIDNGHPVWVFYVLTKPGEKRVLKVEWVEPLVDLEGKNIQSYPKLVSPVALNPIKTSVKTPGTCDIPKTN